MDYIARKNGDKIGLLGSNQVEQSQVESWMYFLRTETLPIV